ncbi:MAG: MFS transporter [Parasporobacterium sp.]|nr:MFS transporter [Parasporobacterium sp.]
MLYTAVIFLIGTSIIGGNNNTVFPMFAEIRGWDINILNIVSGIACILKGIGILVFAGAVRRFGPKKLMAVSLLISAAFLVIFGFTTSLPLYLIMILLIGLLGGAYEKNGGMGLTANWWPTKKGVVLGITTIGIILMNIVYVPYMPQLLGSVGLGWGMTIIAIILVIVAVWTLIGIKNTPEEAGEYPDGDPTFAVNGAEIEKLMREYKSPFKFSVLAKDSSTWLIGFGSGFAFMAVMSFIASAIPTMMAYGYDYPFATTIFAVGGVCGIVGSFLFGLIDQKIGTKKTFIIYFICIIIGFVCTLLMPNGPIFCWMAGIIIFAAQGALCNLLPSYVATKYGRWDYTAAYKVIGTIFEIFAGIGVMMTGFFPNPAIMYIVDLVLLVAGLIMMIFSNDKFIGKR